MAKRLVVLAAVVSLAGCGVTVAGGSVPAPGGVVEVQAELERHGLPCTGTPAPPDTANSLTPDADPTLEVECRIGGSTVTIAEWPTANRRSTVIRMAGVVACGFGMIELGVVQDGRWSVSAERADQETDFGLHERVGEALGVTPTVIRCPEN